MPSSHEAGGSEQSLHFLVTWMLPSLDSKGGSSGVGVALGLRFTYLILVTLPLLAFFWIELSKEQESPNKSPLPNVLSLSLASLS